MKDRKVVVIICHLVIVFVIQFNLCGCQMSENHAALNRYQMEHYNGLARQIIAREFPHINLEDDYGGYIWIDKSRWVHVVFSRNSDREEYVGMDRYCHEDFIQETVEVELKPSGEMVAVSVEKRHIPAECVN